MILENLSVHRSPRAAMILKANGSWFLPLPAYSPDLNPIEMAFSKLKSHLRRIGATTFHALITALGNVSDLFTPDECIDGVQFDWRDEARLLLTWRTRFPLPEAQGVKLHLSWRWLNRAEAA